MPPQGTLPRLGKVFFLAVFFVVWYTYTEALLSETIGELSDLGQAGYLTA